MNKIIKKCFFCALAVVLAVGMISCNVNPAPPTEDVTTDSDTLSQIEESSDSEASTDNRETSSVTDETDKSTEIPSVSETTRAPETEKQPETTKESDTTSVPEQSTAPETAPETVYEPAIGWKEEDANGLVYIYLGNGECAVDNNGYASELKTITIPERSPSGYLVTSIKSMYCFDSAEEIILPKTLKIIEDHAFSMLDALKSMVIPDSVESVGEYAFSNCDSLEAITFGSGIRELGINPVLGCSALKEITMKAGNPKYVCANKCIIDVATKTLKFGINDAVIPNDGSVEYIAQEAFRSVKFSVQPVIIPDSVKNIGREAFMLSSLSAVKMGSGVEVIGSSAFYGCELLTEMIVPKGVKKIEDCAFARCTSLETVVLNEGLEVVESSAFAGCTMLANINIPTTVTDLGSDVFSECKNLVTIAIPGNIKVVQGSTFYQCSNLRYVYMLEGVELIVSGAFNGCSRLEYVVIPKSIKSIGDKNFTSKKLTKVYYGGLPTDKDNLGMGYKNSALESAEWYYYGADKAAGLEYKYWILLDGPSVGIVP